MSVTDAASPSGWRRTTPAHPCPICRKGGWCQVSADGAWAQCMRAEGGRHKVDANGCDYWVHRLDGAPIPPAERAELAPGPSVPRAAPEVLNAVYTALLASLTLNSSHRENLRGRGLPDAEINRRGYRTLPPRGRARLAGLLVERFGPAVGAAVPGLYVKEAEGRGWWSLAGRSGLLIPVRDLEERVIALKVRADDDDSPFRYSYVSSRPHGGGGPGAPVHVPLFEPFTDTETVRLTEGELKADIATVYGDLLCLSVAGVACFRSALPVLAALEARTVHLAFDMDWTLNPAVLRALQGAGRTLQAAGLRVLIESWETE